PRSGRIRLSSVITALILLSPIFAFLVVIAAEMLIDLLMVGGTSAVCVVAVGGIGLVLSRKFWRRPEVVRQSVPAGALSSNNMMLPLLIRRYSASLKFVGG